MPVPTSIASLSTTASSNSPQGSEAPTEGDNHIRALYSFIASIAANSGNGWTSPYLALAGGTLTSSLTVPASSTSGPAIRLTNNGTSIAAINDTLGTVEFYSNDVSASSTGVFGKVGVYNEFNGSWDGTASRVDTYMAFSTAADGTMAEAMRIRSDGGIVGTNLLRLQNAGTSIASADQTLGNVEFYSNDASSGSSGVFGKVSVANESGLAWDGTASRVDTYMAFYTTADGSMAEAMRLTSAGAPIMKAPATAPTLSTNSTLTFELTSNTQLAIKVRGADGTTRTVTLTLA